MFRRRAPHRGAERHPHALVSIASSAPGVHRTSALAEGEDESAGTDVSVWAMSRPGGAVQSLRPGQRVLRTGVLANPATGVGASGGQALSGQSSGPLCARRALAAVPGRPPERDASGFRGCAGRCSTDPCSGVAAAPVGERARCAMQPVRRPTRERGASGLAAASPPGRRSPDRRHAESE